MILIILCFIVLVSLVQIRTHAQKVFKQIPIPIKGFLGIVSTPDDDEDFIDGDIIFMIYMNFSKNTSIVVQSKSLGQDDDCEVSLLDLYIDSQTLHFC